MNLRNVDLNLLTVFDAVITEGNVTRAAEKIGMSQPAMSIALSRFRHMAKDELFERTGRGLRPTPRALELAAPIRRALEIVADALEHGTDFDMSRSDRSFNVALSGVGEVVMLPTLMRKLEAAGSKISINTRYVAHTDMEKEMRYGNVDLYLWIVPIESSEIVCTQIGMTSEVCLVRENHPSVGDSLSLEAFASLRHITYQMPGPYGPSIIDRELWRLGFNREHGMSIHSYFDAPRVISQTDMVCTVPRVLGRDLARVHGLRMVRSPLQLEFPVFMQWPRAVDKDAGHVWLRETLAQIFKQEEALAET